MRHKKVNSRARKKHEDTRKQIIVHEKNTKIHNANHRTRKKKKKKPVGHTMKGVVCANYLSIKRAKEVLVF